VRVILLRLEGLEAAGHYQAAWTLGGTYVGLVLHAMGTDFYPRLVAAAGDCALCNRLVNEQTQVSLLLASFGVLATMTLAPLALVIFYSSAFVVAAEALRWICLGMALRVLTWPMGYVIIAKGSQRLYMLTELAWMVVNVGLSYVLVRTFGLAGAAAAFGLSYAFHGLLIYPFVRRLSGFVFDPRTTRIALGFGLVMAAVMLACQFLPLLWATIVGAVLLLFSAIVSIRLLLDLLPAASIPRQLRCLLKLSGVRPQTTEAHDR
jgi:PST family polysaccharide transporter